MLHLFASWFLLKPIFNSEISAYPSFLRPKNIPQVKDLTPSFLVCNA